MAFRLFDLADELIINIVEHLDGEVASLRALALSSRRLQLLAEPLLYRKIFMRRQDVMNDLEKSITCQPRRAQYVEALDCRCQYYNAAPKTPRSFSDLITLLKQTTRLKGLTLESPHCNYSNWRSKDSPAFYHTVGCFFRLIAEGSCNPRLDSIPSEAKPLQHLRRLKLHLNGERKRYWILGTDSRNLFSHPTLRELTLSCAEISGEAFRTPEMESQPVKTPLKRLEMIECNLDIDALSATLSRPKALEYLRIGENLYHRSQSQSYNGLCRRSPRRFFDALALQRCSLRELQYDAGACSAPPALESVREGFEGYDQLQSITLTGERCVALEQALGTKMQHPPPVMSVTIDSHGSTRLPKWFSDATSIGTLVDALPALQQFNLTYIIGAIERESQLSEARMRTLLAISTQLKRGKAGLKVYGKRPRGGTIPPYLYGEVEREPILLYASDGGGIWTDATIASNLGLVESEQGSVAEPSGILDFSG